MRWLRVGEKAWRDFWALLQVIHYSRYVLFFWGGVWGLSACMDLDLMIRNLLAYFRLEAKCFALSYKTPLGTERNGSERARLLARWRNTRYLYFYCSSFIRCKRGGRGGAAEFFFLVQIALDRWDDDQLWYEMLYLLLIRLIPLVLSLLLFFPPLHVLHFTLLPQFVSAILLLPTRHVPGLRQPKLIRNYLNLEQMRYLRARIVKPWSNGRWGLRPIRKDFGRG